MVDGAEFAVRGFEQGIDVVVLRNVAVLESDGARVGAGGER